MATVLLKIEEPQPRPATAQGFALWALGFRPFYLLAGSFAAFSVLLWALQFAGALSRPWLAGPLWHAHEMLFGFGLAVVVGFLFTAGRNWSGQPTPTGWPLAALALLWVAGRVLVLTPWGGAAAAVNVAFPVAAALGLAIPLVRARNRRNYFFVAVVLGFGAAQLAMHLSLLGVLDLPVRWGLQAALDLLMFVMAVMGGRVIPMFTMNGVPGVNATRHPVLERLALGTVLGVLALDVAGVPGAQALHDMALAVLLAAAAVVHAARLVLWQPWRTLRKPLVWVLHAAYAFIVLHLALRAAAAAGWITASVATHALTAGAIGLLTLGMMTRTARGHTARPLKADGLDVAAYLAVLSGALVRVGVPLVAPQFTVQAAVVSGALWASGFAIYTIRYAPFLLRPRLDGKPG